MLSDKDKGIIHGGVLACFDPHDEEPDANTYGWSKDIKHLNEIVALTREILSYIAKYKLSKSSFEKEFREDLLDNKHYLKLSILGNKIEYLCLKDKTERELNEYFKGFDEYYTAQDVKRVIDFLESLLNE